MVMYKVYTLHCRFILKTLSDICGPLHITVFRIYSNKLLVSWVVFWSIYRLMMMLTGSYLSSFLQNTLKSNQVEINTDSRTLRPIAKLREPRDLFALPKELDCPQQAARWPAECQVPTEPLVIISFYNRCSLVLGYGLHRDPRPEASKIAHAHCNILGGK